MTLPLGLDAVVHSTGGAGPWFSAASVALIATALYATRLTRRLSRPVV